MSFKTNVMADVHRQYGKSGWGLVIKALLTKRNYRVLFTMRACNSLKVKSFLFKPLLIALKLLHRIFTNAASMDLPSTVNVGKGLAITHGWGLVVNGRAVIGENVTLFHGVTLGCRDRIDKDGNRVTEFPTIENNVWVGPHAMIVGGVTIGEGSRIGGGAFVATDIPAFSVVTGNPSNIVKSGCTPDVMNPS